ncbi:MAG TPA: septum formation family protein, partial [Pseudonocardiaceae bacterium]|nr:septum formation family protein [Pseudonocardiaceae bacterium]
MQRPDAATPGPLGPDRRGAGVVARRVAGGAVLGAFVALLAVVLPGGVDVGAVFTGASDAAKAAGAQPLRAPVHTCLTWQQRDAADARQVSCAQPHLFEVTGTVDLTDFDPQTPFPDAARWHELVTTRCTERTSQALAGGFDPFGRFTVGAIKPSEDSWRRGDRTLRCGVQSTGRSGALFLTTGRLMTQNQSDVHPPGTCLGNDGKTVGDPVDCARPHAVEVVGVVDLVGAFPGGYPDEPAQDRVLDAECTRLAAEYARGPGVVGEKKLTVFWETLRRQSWQAGSTRVDCRLGAFLPDRSGFAPVTGSVRGPVQIGTEPAPPAPKTTGPSRLTMPPVVDAATPGPPPP